MDKSFLRTSSSPQDDKMCEACGKRSKYGDFAYCGRTCGQSVPRCHTLCALPGCRTFARKNDVYCSDHHSKEDAAGNSKHTSHSQWNSARPRGHNSSNHNSPSSPQHGRGTQLRELDPNGATFLSAKDYFESTWYPRDSSAKVERIIQITAQRDEFEKYRDNISGQEIKTFHGAQCICDFGVKGTALCKIPSCGICNVVRSSFTSFAFGVPHNTGRFGAGIYSYENPALADKFATSCTSSPFRVVIACSVALAPNGQSSSRGSNPFARHNQDPVFVADSKAILPLFLILYTRRQNT